MWFCHNKKLKSNRRFYPQYFRSGIFDHWPLRISLEMLAKTRLCTNCLIISTASFVTHYTMVTFGGKRNCFNFYFCTLDVKPLCCWRGLQSWAVSNHHFSLLEFKILCCIGHQSGYQSKLGFVDTESRWREEVGGWRDTKYKHLNF